MLWGLSTFRALGGSDGFKTRYFRDLVAYGAAGYVSQRLYGPEEKGGSRLLALQAIVGLQWV